MLTNYYIGGIIKIEIKDMAPLREGNYSDLYQIIILQQQITIRRD